MRVDASLPLTDYDETFLGRIVALDEYVLPADAPDRRRRSLDKLCLLRFVERHRTIPFVYHPTWTGRGYVSLARKRYGHLGTHAA